MHPSNPVRQLERVGVPVNVAPKEPVSLTGDLPFMAVEGWPFGGFVRVREFLLGRRFGRFFRGGRREGCRRGQGGKKDAGGLVGLVRSLVGWPAKRKSPLPREGRENGSPVLSVAAVQIRRLELQVLESRRYPVAATRQSARLK